MNIFKKIVLAVLIPALLGVGGGFIYNQLIPKPAGEIAGASVLFPYQGGTGTGTAPNTGGKFLISTSGGVYTPAYITAGTNITTATSSGAFTINGLSDASIRGLFSSSATGLTYTSGTGDFSLTGGYEIFKTASASQWNAFYHLPSSVITAGTGFAWSGNTFGAASGYGISKTASQSSWEAFQKTPSTRITAGTNLSWSGNTLNASGGGTPGGSNRDIQYNNNGAFGGFGDYASGSDTFTLTGHFAGVTASLSGNIETSGRFVGNTASISGLNITSPGPTSVQISNSKSLQGFLSIAPNSAGDGSYGILMGKSVTTLSESGIAYYDSSATEEFKIIDAGASLSGNFQMTGRFISTGLTASNSFAGSLNIAKGLVANAYSGGGLSACSAATKVLRFNSGQFSCGTLADADIPDTITLSGGTIGSNNISGTLTTTGTLTIGDGGDAIVINSSNWNVSSAGAFTGVTGITSTGNIDFNGATYLKIPVAATPTIDANGKIGYSTASSSFDAYNGTSATAIPLTCTWNKTFYYESPTKNKPTGLGVRLYQPLIITKITSIASPSASAVGWNLRDTAGNTVFSTTKSASTSFTYTTFTKSTFGKGTDFSLSIASKSAVSEFIKIDVCGYNSH